MQLSANFRMRQSLISAELVKTVRGNLRISILHKIITDCVHTLLVSQALIAALYVMVSIRTLLESIALSSSEA